MSTIPRSAARPPAGDGDRGDAERSCECNQLDLPERERQRVDRPGEQRDGRDQEDGDLSGRRRGDLGGKLDLPALGDDHRAAVLGGVADHRHDHGSDEEVGQPGLVGEVLERADENLRDERGRDRRDREHDEREPERPAGEGVVLARVQLGMAAQRPPGDDQVERRAARPRREATSTASECRFGSPCQPGTAGIRNSAERDADQRRARGTSTPGRARRRRPRAARTRGRAGGCRRRCR